MVSRGAWMTEAATALVVRGRGARLRLVEIIEMWCEEACVGCGGFHRWWGHCPDVAWGKSLSSRPSIVSFPSINSYALVFLLFHITTLNQYMTVTAELKDSY